MARRPVPVLLLLAVVGLSPLGVPASPAAADCSGPTIRRIEPAVRGEVITIEGYAFGDNCYDTGPPPEGEGVLGVPVSDMELLIVQGDREVVVASGSANDEYEFSVDVTVPPRLEPGSAQLVARWGTTRSTVQTLEILPDTPVADPPMTTPHVTFGPASASSTAPASVATSEPGVEPTAEASHGATGDGDDGGGSDDSPVLLVACALVLVVSGLAGAVWWARRRSQATEPDR